MVRGAAPPGGSPRRLGQNFLADPNLLDVIVREADLSADDVVLEVGGGGGVRVLAQANGEDALHPGIGGRGDQLGIGRLAEREMGVGIDHESSLREGLDPLGSERAQDEVHVAERPGVERGESLEPAEDEEEWISLRRRGARLRDPHQARALRRPGDQRPTAVT